MTLFERDIAKTLYRFPAKGSRASCDYSRQTVQQLLDVWHWQCCICATANGPHPLGQNKYFDVFITAANG